ncbi:TonB family protein [Aestuariibacter sp. AA17]|uniref:Protein TonB n=1 Tax=Fluctibacter corallii TaxID=2984329 RepID=A0ABT3AAM7_9ALTE|nr:energy transducer TonB [Aestuariibacter sp. AA17]MCV2885723.1 TonB family protein [Aestuariibacter sp. AA17]
MIATNSNVSHELTFITQKSASNSSMIRTLSSIALAAAVSFGLFAMMNTLIKNDQAYIAPTEGPVVIDFLPDIQDENTNEKSPMPKQPEPIERPIERREIEPLEPNEMGFNGGHEIVKPTHPNNLVDKNTLQSGDNEARPIVRVGPKYPPDAARNGLEGWVKLSFSINTDGTVINVNIIDAEPARIFNREAKRALSKWKYKPQLIDGKPVMRNGLEVILQFTLEK